MDIIEAFKLSGYHIPKNKFEEADKQFDYWDMIAFALFCSEEATAQNDKYYEKLGVKIYLIRGFVNGMLTDIEMCNKLLPELLKHVDEAVDIFKE